MVLLFAPISSQQLLHDQSKKKIPLLEKHVPLLSTALSTILVVQMHT